MPDLDLAPAPARDLSPSPAPTEAGTLERAQNVFEAAFGRAYDTPREPDRGERVLGDVEMEARTFGDVRALQALAAEGYGRAADPLMNAALVDTLQTDIGRETVLHALKAGTPTPGRGDDLVVLLDREGASGFGHTAVLIGNDYEGWTLHSKDGTTWPLGVVGPATWTNDENEGQRVGPRFAEFDTLDDFFRDAGKDGLADRYEAAVRIEFEPGDDLGRGDAARAGADAIIGEPYRLLTSSCAHTVERALEAAGVEGFAVHPTRVLRDAIIPTRQFEALSRLEFADDVRSPAQIAWEQRSAHDGR